MSPKSQKPRHPQRDRRPDRTLSGKKREPGGQHDPGRVSDAEKAKRVEPKERTGAFYQQPPAPEVTQIVEVEAIGIRERRRRVRRERGGLKGFTGPSGSAKRNKPQHWLAKAKAAALARGTMGTVRGPDGMPVIIDEIVGFSDVHQEEEA